VVAFVILVLVSNAISSEENSEVKMSTIEIATYEEVKDLPNHPEKLLIDVREPSEIEETGSIPRSVNIPRKFSLLWVDKDWLTFTIDVRCNDSVGQIGRALSDQISDREFEFLYRVKKPKLDDKLIFSCRTGNRSNQAIQHVLPLGYSK